MLDSGHCDGIMQHQGAVEAEGLTNSKCRRLLCHVSYWARELYCHTRFIYYVFCL